MPRPLALVALTLAGACIDGDNHVGDVADTTTAGDLDMVDSDPDTRDSATDSRPDAGCNDNEDCPLATEACQENVCDPATGKCSLRAQPGDSPCDDHDACTRSDRCGAAGEAGICIGHDPVVCQAAGDCGEVGVCNPLSGACTQPSKADGALCEDALDLDQLSRTAGTCVAGACQRLPIVEAGGFHACAVLADGGMRCWGRALQGTLGRGDEAIVGDGFGQSVAEAGALALPGVRTFELGFSNTCGVASDGLRCWGDNTGGVLGTGDLADRGGTPETAASKLSPIDLGPNFTPVAAALGSFDGCALSTSGAIKCWGTNVVGYPNVAAIGTPGNLTIAQIGPVALDSDAGPFVASAIDHGFTHVCALAAGNIRCWGRPAAALGIGATEPLGDDEAPGTAPLVNQGWTAASLSTSSEHTCAVTSDGGLYCWGANAAGQLGDGSTEARPVATKIVLGQGQIVSAVAAGGRHTCVLLSNGTVMCWGDNTDAQLGRGDTSVASLFAAESVQVKLGGEVHAITAGDEFTCAVMRDGAVRCFGRGFFGNLGNGSTETIGDAPSDMPPAAIVF